MLLLLIRVLVWLWARLLVSRVAVPVIATDPATDADVGITDDWSADIHDFDPTSGWGDDDEVTAAMPVCGGAKVTTTVTSNDRCRQRPCDRG